MVRCLDVGFKQKKRPLNNHRCMQALSHFAPPSRARQDSIIFTDKRRINWRSGI